MNFPPNTVRTTTPSPLGTLTLAASPRGLVGVWFGDQAHLPELAPWPVQTDHPMLLQTARELDAYFAGKGFNFSIPLDMAYGTAFQQQVWKCLRETPAGSTTTYGAISHRLGNPNAVRAVGGAVGRNPIGIIVPCHRVIGTNGALTGYAGGLERKVALLTLEGIDLPAVVRSESHPTTGNLF
jgi:methylated-DNA-[protein]-cysteine S-methyltransferase